MTKQQIEREKIAIKKRMFDSYVKSCEKAEFWRKIKQYFNL